MVPCAIHPPFLGVLMMNAQLTSWSKTTVRPSKPIWRIKLFSKLFPHHYIPKETPALELFLQKIKGLS
jgi:hypothetical protein